ncbi:MAG: hypothetical protein C0397_06695 [Odoribacter sp.]|nr:hypothetical protein [Odoribacter sp.]
MRKIILCRKTDRFLFLPENKSVKQAIQRPNVGNDNQTTIGKPFDHSNSVSLFRKQFKPKT